MSSTQVPGSATSTVNGGVERDEMLNGERFLDSLRDGRQIWFDGERVADVTTHPAFRNSAREVARLYDALHDPATRDRLTTVDRFGHRTHAFFAPAYSADDLRASRDAIEVWQRMTFGWMGRTPDYKAAFMAQLAEGHDYYGTYSANGLNWYHRSARHVLYMNHVLIDPPVDRSRPRIDGRDVFVTIDGEDDNGIYVSGAKMVATGSVLTHATFVAVNSGVAARMEAGRDDDMAVVFIVDMDAPGLKVICRPSHLGRGPGRCRPLPGPGRRVPGQLRPRRLRNLSPAGAGVQAGWTRVEVVCSRCSDSFGGCLYRFCRNGLPSRCS
jgi:4-hydroxyphenylacetate 3-monooxygenase